MKPLYSTQEAVDELGGAISKWTLQRLIAAGHVRASRVGKGYVITGSELRTLIDTLSGEHGPRVFHDSTGRQILQVN